ncbi:MAG TPA: HlyD family secretion protein [Tepidisphaeraceae bacterium]|jgi:membrane fusion protein (multidrug efflux system)|nr:HlyD family secretion protein [Tepidisphaeraceae bacterium]
MNQDDRDKMKEEGRDHLDGGGGRDKTWPEGSGCKPGEDVPEAWGKKREDRKEKKGEKKEEKEGEEEGSEDKEKEEKKPEPWSPMKKVVVGGIIGLVLVLGIVVGVAWWMYARQFETTDDAFIDAHTERVAPQVAGRVLRVLVADNQEVKAGDPLVEVDPADFQAAVEQAEAGVAEARGKLAQAEAQKQVAQATVEQGDADVEQAKVSEENAKAQLGRYEGLSKEAQSPQRLDDLRAAARNAEAQRVAMEKKVVAEEAQVQLAQSQIVSGQADVQAAQARLDQAKLNIGYTGVRATIAGRVTNRNVQAGDYLTSGQQLMVLVPDEVWVTANYKETQLARMRVGQEVEISVDAYPDMEFRGKVDSVQKGSGAWFSLLPPENATGNYVKVVQRVPVKIVFEDRDSEAYRRLSPGMSVTPKVRIR